MTERRAGITEEVVTLEEFWEMPEEDAYRVELVRGRVVREPPPAAAHTWISSELSALIRSFVLEHDLGIALTEPGFLLAVDPPTVRRPDAAFIAKEKLPPGGFSLTEPWTMAPDLAIEVLSPSNRAGEILEKVLDYLACGTRLVWVVDPQNRCVTAYRSRDDIRLLREGDRLEGGDVLPGFELPVSQLFAPIERA